MALTIANAAAKIVNNAGGTVAAAIDVEGGYFSVDSLDDIPRHAYVKGALCYCFGTSTDPINKFYICDGTTWVEKTFSEGGGIQEETDPTVPDWAKKESKPTYDYTEIENTPPLGSLASKSTVEKSDLSEAVQTSLGKADSAVPTSRKINNKELSADIELTASDVGALPNTTSIPTKVSDLTNDAGYVTKEGALGLTPYIDANSGIWQVPNQWIGKNNTHIRSETKPHIGGDGYWYVGQTKTGIEAQQYLDGDFVPIMSDVDNAEKDQTEEFKGRIFSEPLLINIQGKRRAYVNQNANGRVNPYYNLELNAENGAAKLYHPWGYASLEDMVNGEGWSGIELTNAKHYKKIGHGNDKYTYHPRLNAIALRSIEGNLRTGTPRDSTDCINKEYANSTYVRKNDTSIGSIGYRIAELEAELALKAQKPEAWQYGIITDTTAGNNGEIYSIDFKLSDTRDGIYEISAYGVRSSEYIHLNTFLFTYEASLFTTGVDTIWFSESDTNFYLKADTKGFTFRVAMIWNSRELKTYSVKMRKIRDI